MTQSRNSVPDTAGVTSNHEFTIYGAFFKEKCFPSLNDLLHEASRNPMAYGKMKKQYEMVATSFMRKGLGTWVPRKKVRLHFYYGEPNKGQRRDLDNVVAAAKKIICDALVKAHYLKDDKPEYLALSCDEEVVYTASQPYIRVVFEEIDSFTE